jgi:hypothetical protein
MVDALNPLAFHRPSRTEEEDNEADSSEVKGGGDKAAKGAVGNKGLEGVVSKL